MKWIENLTGHNTMTDGGIAVGTRLFPLLHLMRIIASGFKIFYVNQSSENPPPPPPPCIYVANHSNSHDLPVMARVINTPFFCFGK